MNTHQRKAILFLLLTIALQGCASSGLDQRLDEKLAQEPAISSRKELRTESAQFTDSSPGITANQKKQLAEMREDVRKKLDENGKRSLELRAVLIQDVVSPNYDSKEIKSIEDRLRVLSKNRLDIMFHAVDTTNDILGRSAMVREAMDEEFLEDNALFY